MSKNAWIIWALILMTPGVAGLGYHYAQRSQYATRVAEAAKVVDENRAADEYLDMYDRWYALTPEDKAENPWGQDPYGGPAIRRQLKDNQDDRLTADLADLDKGLKHYPEELAETLYGSRWPQVLAEYRKAQEKAEMLVIGSIFLLAGGTVILTGGLGKLLFSLCFTKKAAEEIDEAETAAPEETAAKSKEKPPLTIGRNLPQSDVDKIIATKSDSDNPDEKTAEPIEPARPGYFQTPPKPRQTPPVTSASSDAKPLTALPALNRPAAAAGDKPKDSYFGWAVDPDEDPTLETLMTPEPLISKELTELSEGMSAIREFAAQQQDQVRKLQDGYDWMIIRRFCLRIVRCVDNIDDRIKRLDDPADELQMSLEDIRDELIFALESSGVEQFNPDLNMPFKGLEKYAEATRERVPTDDSSLVGCIADVARPGYQYLVSEDDVKVVRCAQVKLYDAKQS